MENLLTENTYEQAIIQLFTEKLSYEHVYGPDVERDHQEPYWGERLREALERLNPHLSESALEEAYRLVTNIDDGDLVARNKRFTDFLQNGVTVSFTVDGEQRSDIAYLVDYDDVDNNDLVVANQWTYVERRNERRPDVILFLNGLPVVVFELKSPINENTDSNDAYLQLRNYMRDITGMFVYNQICVMSDFAVNKAGTITSNAERYMRWKSSDGKSTDILQGSFEVMCEGMFEKSRLLDILHNFICFNEDGANTAKILAGYHQYYAVNKALDSVEKATRTDGRGGVFWHTQGSGKSLSMVFFAHGIRKRLNNPTLVVLTDRNDLDDQLFCQFARCKEFLRETPVQAKDKAHLKELLDQRKAGGVVFSTMFKFDEYDHALSERSNIVVIADEAHRSQYGLKEENRTYRNKEGELEVRRSIGVARLIRDSLPNATFIGFTGTPVSSKDRNTREVFGDYIDIYDMTQAVEDDATRPVFYESRVVKLRLSEDALQKIDQEYDRFAESTEAWIVEKSKKELGKMDQLLGTDEALDSLVSDILDHYTNYREKLLTGKAMIVAYSREIAVKIYKRILQAHPDWTEKVAVVMTGSNQDPEDWKEIVGTKTTKNELAARFKDNDSPLKIAIVVDMWLTGFDVPSLATMYVYKPMSGHNLMQAIARVNRVYKDKAGGLIVDYVGLMSALKEAMRDYSKRDRDKADVMDIATKAYEEFKNALSVCREIFHDYDYSNYATQDPLQLTKLVNGGANFILATEPKESDKPEEQRTKARFLRVATALKQAYSLCSSIAERDERLQQAFFDAVRVFLTRLASAGGERKHSLKEINTRITELLRDAVLTEGVVDLFDSSDKDFSLFDPKFLDAIAKLKEKNIAVEVLKKLLNGQIDVYKRTNLVKAKKFSEMFQQTLNSYINGLISNEKVIEELLAMAQALTDASLDSKNMGLTEEEQAFYDALTHPAAIKDFYTNDQLVEMTRELTDMLRKSRSIDWNKKESARARMRMLVKRLLKKYKYPPEGQEEALKVVLEQCEQWSEDPDAYVV